MGTPSTSDRPSGVSLGRDAATCAWHGLCPPQVTELLDVSMELGCFLAGALVSSQGHAVAEEVVSYVEPVRDFLAIVFFASIGDRPPGAVPLPGLVCSRVSTNSLCGKNSPHGG